VTLTAVEHTATPPEPPPSQGRRRAGGLGVYAVRRVLTGIGTMAFVVVFNFFLFRLLPGDPITLYTRGRNVDRAQLIELRRQLNKPIHDQFVTYLQNPFSSGVDSTQFSPGLGRDR
jgi:ABC-type dipeptide/oligopeptide/nickel transport system permease component